MTEHLLKKKERGFRKTHMVCTCGVSIRVAGRGAHREAVESFKEHVSMMRVLSKIHEYNKGFPRSKGEW